MNPAFIEQLEAFKESYDTMNGLLAKVPPLRRRAESIRPEEDLPRKSATPSRPAFLILFAAIAFVSLPVFIILIATGVFPGIGTTLLIYAIFLAVCLLFSFLVEKAMDRKAGTDRKAEREQEQGRKQARLEAERDRRQKEYEESVAAAEQAVQAAEIAAAEYIAEHFDALSVVPQQEWYPRAIDYLLLAARTGRADDMKEALRLLDEQKHRWTMEGLARETLAAQKQQAAAMQSLCATAEVIKADTRALRSTAAATSWTTFWTFWQVLGVRGDLR